MEIVNVDIEKLKHAEYNPRKISDKDFDQIRESIDKFGFVQPLVVNNAPGRSDVIVGGNQRFEVAKKIGMKEVPVCYVNIQNLEEEKELNIRLNRNQGQWDWDLLISHFESSQLSSFGFSDIEINIFDEKKNLKEEEQDTPPIPITSRAQQKFLYTLGRHRLLCGDCTDWQNIKFLMNGEKARLIFTDPPYSVNYKSSAGNSYGEGKYGDGKIFNDDKTEEEALEFYKKILTNLYDFSTDDATLYWWFANKMNWINRLAWINTGWNMAQIIIWLKEQMIFSMGQDYHRCYEPCMFGWKKGNKHYSNKRLANYTDCLFLGKEEFKDLYDVWYENRDKTNEYVHPTQKPVKLAHRALRKNSIENDIVIDLFGGSGSTLIACEQMNRVCRLTELDPKYVDVIIQRYCNFTGSNIEEIYSKAEQVPA